MGATSVTGVSGPGESGGKYKPENNCGCGCCGPDEEEPTEKVKLGCYTRYRTQGTKTYRVGGGVVNTRVC